VKEYFNIDTDHAYYREETGACDLHVGRV
jgi:hypothetical protein